MDLPELLLHPRTLQHLPHGLAGNPPVVELGQDHPPDLRVFLVHTDGSSDHEVLTGIPGRHNHPDFSRDGKRPAFDQLTSEQDSSQVYVADADGAHARRLPPCRTPKCAGHWEPAWSPDGTRLAVSTDIGAPPGQSELYTVRPDGTGRAA